MLFNLFVRCGLFSYIGSTLQHEPLCPGQASLYSAGMHGRRILASKAPMTNAQLLRSCKRVEQPAMGIGENIPTWHIDNRDLAAFNAPIQRAMADVISRTPLGQQQIEFPLQICGPSGAQSWGGRQFDKDVPQTLAWWP